MATRRSSSSTTTPAKKTTPAPARKTAPVKLTRPAGPGKAAAPAKSAPARKGRAPAAPARDGEEHHRHERVVSIAATQHVVRSKTDGTIVARICVQSEHVLYGARDSKMWRRVTLGDFAAFMERAGELVKNWDGGN